MFFILHLVFLEKKITKVYKYIEKKQICIKIFMCLKNYSVKRLFWLNKKEGYFLLGML